MSEGLIEGYGRNYSRSNPARNLPHSPYSILHLEDFLACGLEMTGAKNCTSFCHFDRREKSSSSKVAQTLTLVDFSASGLEMTRQKDSTASCHFDPALRGEIFFAKGA
jgi:hypothetical protein